jgi:hypothetical protein
MNEYHSIFSTATREVCQREKAGKTPAGLLENKAKRKLPYPPDERGGQSASIWFFPCCDSFHE